MALILNLANLNGNQGFQVYGSSGTGGAGYSVSGVGDVNGDNYTDIIIGAPKSSPGASYILLGNNKTSNFVSIDLGQPTAQVISIGGIISGSETGYSVSGAGDINGDGFGDFVIGAPNADSNVGISYVVYGKLGLLDIDLSSSEDCFTIHGINSNDYSGWSVSGAGDFNKDGFNDIIIGAYGVNSKAGASYLIYGNKTNVLQDINLASLLPTQGFPIYGALAGDESGYSVSGAGDINGDGYGDIIIGAPYSDPNGKANSGTIYIIFGNSNFPASIQLPPTSSQGFSIYGASTGDQTGYSVRIAGFINNDTYSDIIIGAPNAAYNGQSKVGISYVIFGSNNLIDIQLPPSSSQGFSIYGAISSSYSGAAVSGAGDINQDGFGDVIIGAPGAPNASPNPLYSNNTDSQVANLRALSTSVTSGVSYVIFGKAMGYSNISLAGLTSAQGFTVIGAASGDNSGNAVSGTGDFNGDGYSDIIIGAPNADYSSGISYVILNASAIASPTYMPTLSPIQHDSHSDDDFLRTGAIAGFAGAGFIVLGIVVLGVCGGGYCIYNNYYPADTAKARNKIAEYTRCLAPLTHVDDEKALLEQELEQLTKILDEGINPKKMKEIKSQIKKLEYKVKNLEFKEEILRLEEQIDQIKRKPNSDQPVDIDGLKQNLTKIQNAFSKFGTKIEGMTARIRQAERDINGLAKDTRGSDSPMHSGGSKESLGIDSDDIEVYAVHNIKYDNPRLNNPRISEVLKELYQSGGIRSVNDYLDQPKILRLSDSIKPDISSIKNAQAVIKYNKVTTTDNMQFSFSSDLMASILNVRQIIEYLPFIKHITQDIINRIGCDITLPEVLDNRGVLLTGHLILGNAAASVLPNGLITTGMIVSNIGTGAYAIRLISADYLKAQQPTDEPMEIIAQCGAAIMLYNLPNFATFAAVHLMLPGVSYGLTGYDALISSSFGVIHCSNNYKVITDQQKDPTITDTAVPLIVDTGILLLLSSQASFGASSIDMLMLSIKNCMSVVTTIYAADSVTRIVIDFVPQEMKEEYIEPIFDQAMQGIHNGYEQMKGLIESVFI